jgi:hypothetical protein
MAEPIAIADADQVAVTTIRRTLRKLVETKVVADDTVRLATLTDKAFRQEFPPVSQPDNRLSNAIARGIPARQKLIGEEGGTLSAQEAAERLGVSKPAILKRYQKGQLLAWREEKQDAVRFPAWQFVDAKVLPGIKEVLQVLQESPLDDFGKLLFFLSTFGSLGNKRPLDCLRGGKVSQALQAAQGYAAA